jgi:thioester reductase-like protein
MNSVQRKVSLIQGDLLETGLGLSPQNRRELCQEVSIVFHVAGTIRFNENLKVALQTNVIATQEIVNLCKEMPLLAVSLKQTHFVVPALCYAVIHLDTVYRRVRRIKKSD